MTHPRQTRAGSAPLGLALLLEQGTATLVAPPQALGSGVALLELAAAVPGPLPGSIAQCRSRRCALQALTVEVDAAAVLAWVRARAPGPVPGWRLEHVAWDMLEGAGDPWTWTLRGRDEAGEAVWLCIELWATSAGGCIEIRPRRCWLLGPPGLQAERVWRALARRLGAGAGGLVIDVPRAALGRSFAGAGWPVPAGAVGVAGLEVGPEGVRLRLAAGAATWSQGQAAEIDPLAALRGALRGDPATRRAAGASLRAIAEEVPALAQELARARAQALRFVDREGCGEALAAWVQAAPAEVEPRWLQVAMAAVRGDLEGVTAALGELVELPAGPGVVMRRRLALALALQRSEAGAAQARALLEPMVAELPQAPAGLQAAVWRALARARAGDAAAPGGVVEDAVAAALGDEGWRRRGETGELRAQVAAALVGSGRAEADTTRLLRRMLGDERPGRTVRAVRGEHRSAASRASEPLRPARRSKADRGESARIVADYYAQEGRWSELITLLGRELVQLDGVARLQALRRIARIHRHYLHDPASAEQALRVALAQPAEDEAMLHDRLLLHGELVTCLEMQGRFAEAVVHLEAALQAELSDETGDLAPERAELLVRLARLARDGLDDEARAAPAFAALMRAEAAPDDGLATLTRVYRGSGDYVALAGVLRLRLVRVDPDREIERAAELHRRLAELLDGPLAGGGEAAVHHLAAYLADPQAQASCGARARALLAAPGVAAATRHATVAAVLAELPGDPLREVQAWTLAAEAAAAAGGVEEAEALFRAALASAAVELAPGTGENVGLAAGTGERASAAGLSAGTGAWVGAPEDDLASAAVGAAAGGLGRVLLGLGRDEEAIRALGFAAGRRGLADATAIECALLAARAAIAGGRAGDAERVLVIVRGARPVDERVLLELARVYAAQRRGEDEEAVLGELLARTEGPALRAEALLRRARLRDYLEDPRGGAGAEALVLLQAAFAADPRHADARDMLRSLAEARGAWPVVVQAIMAALRGLAPGPERVALLLDLSEVHLLRLHDADSAARSLERAFALAPADALVRRRVVGLLVDVREDMSRAPGFDEHGWLRGLTDSGELGDPGVASVWLTLGESCLRTQDVAGAAAAWQRVFALGSPGESALAEARHHLGTLGEGGDLQAQRVALQRLLAGEDQAEERLPILARLWELGEALGEDELVEASCREALALAQEDPRHDELREAAASGLRGLLTRRGAAGEIAALYAGLDAQTRDAGHAARALVDAARFAGQVLHDGALAASLAHRAWRRAPDSTAAQAMLAEIAEHAAHGPALLLALDAEDLSGAPELALRLADAAVRVGRVATGRRWLSGLAQSPDLAMRRGALDRLDALLASTGPLAERLPVLRARVAAYGEADRRAGLSLELARLELELGEFDAALASCLSGPIAAAEDPALLELAGELLARREQWAEVTAVCERRAELAAQAGDGAGESAWLTRAAQVCIDHATHPRRAMQDARRLLLRACAADVGGEGARALLVPLSFAEHRWEEVLQAAGELRALGGEDYDVQIVAALTEALVHGRSGLARAIGARHEAATLRRMLWPALARVLGEVARHGTLAQLDAVLAAAAALHGSAARLRVELQAWSAGRALQPGLTLGLARLHESIGHAATARGLWQLAAFMVPQGPIAAQVAALPALPVPPDVLANDREPALESREALRAVLRRMASETAGIRAGGEPPMAASTPTEHEALAEAEAELGPLRVALGLPLPLVLGRGGPEGGVGVRNDRPPAVVVSAALAGLPAAERRFRIALAATTIASGLAVVTDPHGASLPELLGALLHLADETCPARLVGAQAIVRACAGRGFTRERLPAGLREALAREVSRWQQNRGSLVRLAHLLRRDNLRVATRLSGCLDGALRSFGRDTRLLAAGDLDERGAAQVLASEDAQWLLRSLGVFG